jgi:hypothetical protein
MNTTRTPRLLTTVGLSAALLLGVAPYAAAQTDLHNDPAHDVRRASPEDDVGPHLPDPRQRDGDITFLVTRHTFQHVSVMTKFRDLRRVGAVRHWYVIRGPRQTYGVRLTATRGHRSGVLKIWHYRTGRAATCPGAVWRIDYQENRTRLILPVRCLHRPHWVRIASGWLGVAGWQRGDDALADDYDIHTLHYGKRLVASPFQ